MLDRKHRRKAFNCGVEPLDRYLREFALQDMKRRIATCFVIHDDARNIAGFYTLAATSVAFTSLPPEAKASLPRYPVMPAVLIGRLAVSVDHQRQGLGSAMIADAIIRTDRLNVGAFALLVDAKDEQAQMFYENNGFTLLPEETRRLFLTMETATTLLKY
jgi:GNAT superfamily N-acetyltransferase